MTPVVDITIEAPIELVTKILEDRRSEFPTTRIELAPIGHDTVLSASPIPGDRRYEDRVKTAYLGWFHRKAQAEALERRLNPIKAWAEQQVHPSLRSA